MLTRVFQTRFWQDEFILEAPKEVRYLFQYLLTNPYINLSGIYQLAISKIAFETGLSIQEVRDAFAYLENNNKATYKDGWVFVINAVKDNKYINSPDNHKPYNEELKKIPTEIYEFFSTFREIPFLDIPEKNWKKSKFNTTVDSTVNSTQNKEIRNKNSKLKNKNKENNNNEKKFEKEAYEVLQVWNDVKNTKYKSIEGFYNNLEKWLKVYSIDEINQSIRNTPIDKDFLGKVTDVSTFFRHKNTQGENVDYIGRCLQFDAEEAESMQEGFEGFMEIVNKIASPLEFKPTDEAKQRFEADIKLGYQPKDFVYVIKTAFKDRRFRGDNPQKRDYFNPATILKPDVIQDYLNRKKGGGTG